MYKCSLCKQVSKPNEKKYSIIIKKRPKKYTNEVRGKMIISEGWEIEKEMAVCEKCYRGKNE